MDSNHNLTPNVQTIFTAATNRRDMKLLSSGSSPADNRPLADSRSLRSSVDQTASLEGAPGFEPGAGLCRSLPQLRSYLLTGEI